MEIHRQTCQNCGSRHMRNIILRDHEEVIYLQCDECGKPVARYLLASGGYFHFGKGYESFLREMQRSGGFPSGKGLVNRFKTLEEELLAGFEDALDLLKMENKDNWESEKPSSQE